MRQSRPERGPGSRSGPAELRDDRQRLHELLAGVSRRDGRGPEAEDVPRVVRVARARQDAPRDLRSHRQLPRRRHLQQSLARVGGPRAPARLRPAHRRALRSAAGPVPEPLSPPRRGSRDGERRLRPAAAGPHPDEERVGPVRRRHRLHVPPLPRGPDRRCHARALGSRQPNRHRQHHLRHRRLLLRPRQGGRGADSIAVSTQPGPRHDQRRLGLRVPDDAPRLRYPEQLAVRESLSGARLARRPGPAGVAQHGLAPACLHGRRRLRRQHARAHAVPDGEHHHEHVQRRERREHARLRRLDQEPGARLRGHPHARSSSRSSRRRSRARAIRRARSTSTTPRPRAASSSSTARTSSDPT